MTIYRTMTPPQNPKKGDWWFADNEENQATLFLVWLKELFTGWSIVEENKE